MSPNTAVVKPINVVNQLRHELQSKGVVFFDGISHWSVKPEAREISFNDGDLIQYGHVFNSAGLQADRVAHLFGVGMNYSHCHLRSLLAT